MTVERDVEDCYKAEYMRRFEGRGIRRRDLVDHAVRPVCGAAQYRRRPCARRRFRKTRLRSSRAWRCRDILSGREWRLGGVMRVRVAGVDVSLGQCGFRSGTGTVAEGAGASGPAGPAGVRQTAVPAGALRAREKRCRGGCSPDASGCHTGGLGPHMLWRGEENDPGTDHRSVRGADERDRRSAGSIKAKAAAAAALGSAVRGRISGRGEFGWQGTRAFPSRLITPRRL